MSTPRSTTYYWCRVTKNMQLMCRDGGWQSCNRDEALFEIHSQDLSKLYDKDRSESCSMPAEIHEFRFDYLAHAALDGSSQPKKHGGLVLCQLLLGCQILNTGTHHLPSQSLCQSSEAHQSVGHGQDVAADTQPTV